MEASSFVQVERFGRIYTGGKVEVTDDGCFIVCVCGEHLKVLDLATGKAVLTIAAEGDDFTAFALHPNRPQLVSAGRSRQLRHWSLQLPHRPSTTTTSASTAATTATATATASASASATASSSASASSSTSALEPSSECIRVWKAHKLPVVELAYERTGTLVASGGADSVVMVFDVPKGFCTHVFRGHSGVVHRLLFHPTRLVLFSSANDNAIRAWDLKTKTCLGVLDAHVSLPSSLALSADGSLLLSGGRDQLVHVWDTDTLELSGSVAVMEALEAIVVEAPSGDARSEEASDAFSHGLPLTATHLFPHQSQAVWSRAILSRAILSRAILFRTCHTACFVTRHSPPPFVTRHFCLQSQDAPVRFMSCGEKGLVRTWEWVRTTRSGKQLSTQASPKGLTSALPSLTQLMRCGDQLLGVTDDQNLHLLDPSSLHLERTIVGYNDEITDLRIVPAEAASESSVSGLDDALVAVATNSEQIRLFSVATMGCELLLGHSDIVLALDVHPRRRWLASSSKDATVRIWDLGSAECIGSCVGHMEAVGAVAFGGDAELVSGSKDKTLKRWDLTALIPKAERAKPGKSSKQVEQTRRANKSHTQVAHTGRTHKSHTQVAHTSRTHTSRTHTSRTHTSRTHKSHTQVAHKSDFAHLPHQSATHPPPIPFPPCHPDSSLSLSLLQPPRRPSARRSSERSGAFNSPRSRQLKM